MTPAMSMDAKMKRRQLRDQGYIDGRAGRPARSTDPEYRGSYRRGAAARAQEEANDRESR